MQINYFIIIIIIIKVSCNDMQVTNISKIKDDYFSYYFATQWDDKHVTRIYATFNKPQFFSQSNIPARPTVTPKFVSW